MAAGPATDAVLLFDYKIASDCKEKIQFYNVAHASAAEVRSLTYVVEDNYPQLAAEAVALRKKTMITGQLVGGLIRSTKSRKTGTRLLPSPHCT